MLEEIYTSGKYLERWPDWHAAISPWSARQVLYMMARHTLVPKTICEVGCGAGEILKQLQQNMAEDCLFWGYEISPQALQIAQMRANDRLHFQLANIKQEKDIFFDLILLIDVIEHVEDCFDFLRALKQKSTYKIIHIPLDLSARAVMRGSLLQVREQHGHIHYFSKELALQTLQDTGYKVLDYFYTSPSIDLPTEGYCNEIRRKCMKLPRKLLFALQQDMAVRLLGGWSLMVLAQ